MLVRGVLDDPLAAVRFQEGVLPLDLVAVPRLPLALDVVRVQVVDGVVVVVVRVRLEKTFLEILCKYNQTGNLVTTL